METQRRGNDLKQVIDVDESARLSTQIRALGIALVATKIGISEQTIRRAAAGEQVSQASRIVIRNYLATLDGKAVVRK